MIPKSHSAWVRNGRREFLWKYPPPPSSSWTRRSGPMCFPVLFFCLPVSTPCIHVRSVQPSIACFSRLKIIIMIHFAAFRFISPILRRLSFLALVRIRNFLSWLQFLQRVGRESESSNGVPEGWSCRDRQWKFRSGC